ncbi:MAG: trypsin-like peptidase domain-containing protein [Thaumarchaeota archaeon]|nr:trypsin-like peptidase domain-containing protein [Nitrososphaerota archaeon]
MMRDRDSGIGRTATVAIMLLLAVGSSLVYYNSINQIAGPSTSSTNNQQATTATTQGANSTAHPQVSSTTTSSVQAGSHATGTNTSAEQIYSSESNSVVTVQGDEKVTTNTFFGPQTTIQGVLASGFIVSYLTNYYVVTNYHVVNGVSNITVTFWDGNTYPATVAGTDPYSDLAIVRVHSAPTSEFAPLKVVASTAVKVGDPVYAIGNPYGLSGSFTYGIVSQLGRTIQETTAGNYSIAGVIQFSAPINPGNSGGPLLDGNGNVIGITTAVVSGSVGLGFAIPSSTIIEEIPSLVSTGRYSAHSYLGIGGTDMTYQLANAMHSTVTYGVLIENVISGGPASKAGLKGGSTTAVVEGQRYLIGGDIIVSINGTRIVNQDALSTYLTQFTVAGQTVQLGIFRSDQLTTVGVELGARPGVTSTTTA